MTFRSIYLHQVIFHYWSKVIIVFAFQLCSFFLIYFKQVHYFLVLLLLMTLSIAVLGICFRELLLLWSLNSWVKDSFTPWDSQTLLGGRLWAKLSRFQLLIRWCFCSWTIYLSDSLFFLCLVERLLSWFQCRCWFLKRKSWIRFNIRNRLAIKAYDLK